MFIFNYFKTICLSFAVFTSFFIVNELQAKKINFTEICHWQEGKQLYKKLRLPEPAKNAHLANHNDKEVPDSGDCNAADVRIFALAYIDVNQDGVFNSNEDVLISKLEDTNEDGLISAGDVFTQGNYPLNFDPCPGGTCLDVGSFNLQQFVLTQAEADVAISVAGETLGIEVPFGSDIAYEWSGDSQAEKFLIFKGREISITFSDVLSVFGNDYLHTVDPGNTVIDTTFPDQSNDSLQDDYFINIEFDNEDQSPGGEPL